MTKDLFYRILISPGISEPTQPQKAEIGSPQEVATNMAHVNRHCRSVNDKNDCNTCTDMDIDTVTDKHEHAHP